MTAYTLTRSRRKTLVIFVKPDNRSSAGCTVEVRAPLRLSKTEIERYVESKSAWIEQKQIEIRQFAIPQELPPSQYKTGEFEKITRELIKIWEQRLGVMVSFVGFRSMTTRWGSCTAKTRRIRLNAALALCPQECLEYVIVHELTHLRENNHSTRFWKIVEDALPDYRERHKKLKELSWSLRKQNGDDANE